LILQKKDKPYSPMEIDLTGPEGNAFVLMAYARKLGKNLGYSEHRIKCILDEMRLTNYEGLVYTFDREFGSSITLWR
tara:strand:- start:166 stop:396 length:231 start_codon:yes stop_codon:yes gene_type:complete